MAKKIKTKAVAVAGDEELGRVAYEAYAKTRDWKSVEGTPLPQWPDVKTSIKFGWMVAARSVQLAVTKRILGRLANKLDTSPRPSPHSAKAGTWRGGISGNQFRIDCWKSLIRFTANTPYMPDEAQAVLDLCDLLKIILRNSKSSEPAFVDSLAMLLMSIWNNVEEWGTPEQKRMSKIGWAMWGAIKDWERPPNRKS